MATVRIDLQSDLQRLSSRVALLTDQNLRFATSRALTATARAAQAELKQQTPRYINQPTRWTLNGTYVRFARPDTLETEVGFRSDPQGRGNAAGRYLQPIVKGTTPKLKGADLAASKIAREAPGAVLVPAKGSGLTNAAGNVSLSKYATILGQARQGGGQYFVGPVKPGSSIKAVFERKEGFISRTSTLERSTRRVFTIDPNPKQRRPQFPVREILTKAFGQAWPAEVRKAYEAEVQRKLGKR